MENPVSGTLLGVKGPESRRTDKKSIWPLYRPIAWALVTAATALLFVFLANVHPSTDSTGVLGFGLLGASAAALVGGFFGFLFALPRDLSRLAPAEHAAPAAAFASDPARKENGGANGRTGETEEQGQDRARASWANNNLVKVSDWLTTMVVGVGLVEFNNIVIWLGKMGAKVGGATGIDGTSAQESFGTAVLLAGFAIGFLVGYIHTRTEVTTTLASTSSVVERELSSQILSVQRELKEAVIEVDARMENKVATVRDQFEQRERREIDELIKKRDEITGELRNEADALRSTLARSAEVLRHLYEPAPGGFEAALRILDTLLANPVFSADGRLWAYRACALGQKHRHDTTNGANAQALQETVDAAFLSVEHALVSDQQLRSWLRSLWSEEDAAFRSGEDDLTPFWLDPALRTRFAKLLDQDGAALVPPES